MFTVADLKAILNKFPDDLPVGRIGWYGEFYEMGQYDFHRQDGIVAIASFPGDFRTAAVSSFSALAIDPPNIGEEPE